MSTPNPRPFNPVPKPEPRAKKPKARIKQRSTKQARNDRQYAVLRVDYLAANPLCAARVQGCTGKATQIHHKKGRGKLLCNVDFFLSTCDPCHKWIEANPSAARVHGFTLSRLHK